MILLTPCAALARLWKSPVDFSVPTLSRLPGSTPTMHRFAATVAVLLVASAAAFAPAQAGALLRRRASTAPAPLTQAHLFGGKKDDKKKAGGLAGMGNMMDQFKKAQEIQAKTKKLQDELSKEIVVGEEADGGVVVTLSGQQTPMSVVVTDELLATCDSEALAGHVTAAMKAAHSKSLEKMTEKLKVLYDGIGDEMGGAMPGM